MTKCSDLRIGKTRKQRNDIVHQILVVDYGILTLFHEGLDKVAEIAAKFFPLRPRHDHRVLATLLQ